MRKRSLPERIFFILSVICLGLAISAENACQTSYNFADNASVGTPEATEEPEGTATITPTSTATSEAEETPTETPTPTPTEELVSADVPSVREVFGALSDLGKGKGQESGGDFAEARSSANVPGKRSAPSNWLGGTYSKRRSPGSDIDSDGDGFTDALEADSGSDPLDPESQPPPPVTVLSNRLLGFDDDGDGLSNPEELKYGTDASVPDSDGDGALDGAEVISGSNPGAKESLPVDADGDGLSDDYERFLGANPGTPDTDGDGVRDDLEIVLGSNPLEKDSDRDGILDGRELALGADPVLPERQT